MIRYQELAAGSSRHFSIDDLIDGDYVTIRNGFQLIYSKKYHRAYGENGDFINLKSSSYPCFKMTHVNTHMYDIIAIKRAGLVIWTEFEFPVMHILKAEGQYFTDAAEGRKSFEVRKNDREFMVSDAMRLKEVKNGEYTKAYEDFIITYILNDPEYCKEGYVVLGIRLFEDVKDLG